MQSKQEPFKQSIRQNKCFLIDTLQEDPDFILQHVQQDELITDREYRLINRQRIGGEDVVIALLDKLMGKGEETCKKFIKLLERDEVLETFPNLKNHHILATEEQELLDDGLLSELLYKIGRLDLLVIIDTSREQVERRLQACRDPNKGVSAYRYMLYGLSLRITEESLHQMRFQWSKCSKTQLGPYPSFLDIMIDMENQQRLGEDNLEELHNILSKCDQQLACSLEKFKNGHRNQEQGHEDDYYPVTQRPLGYCLIINNFEFSPTSLRNRTGTDKDRDDLTRVFRNMQFLVEVRNDLQGPDMLNVMKEFAEKDHSRMDVFVCCILSHGANSTVLGTDGQHILIRDHTLPYAESHTLATKPKLFFIQACQGSNMDRGVCMENRQETITTDGVFEKDAQMVVSSIPLEADFLIGMATVEHYQSFRNTTEGSIYIQELCKQLEECCPRKEDILSILTKVNCKVSKKILNGHKQIPEPRYTLTRKLVLPWTEVSDH
ncbi:caspase-8-like isoform X2 [Triplophysa rosa]|uniref:caspase-8-like isoform X2 n=1 Tax=Triplophysa rosa TaxID=992332 RepID=UPI002545C1D6|nr:caspase-8-like isoform X2 [Triplophysa rosa]